MAILVLRLAAREIAELVAGTDFQQAACPLRQGCLYTGSEAYWLAQVRQPVLRSRDISTGDIATEIADDRDTRCTEVHRSEVGREIGKYRVHQRRVEPLRRRQRDRRDSFRCEGGLHG